MCVISRVVEHSLGTRSHFTWYVGAHMHSCIRDQNTHAHVITLADIHMATRGRVHGNAYIVVACRFVLREIDNVY